MAGGSDSHNTGSSYRHDNYLTGPIRLVASIGVSDCIESAISH
jgi:hypothetical protein